MGIGAGQGWEARRSNNELRYQSDAPIHQPEKCDPAENKVPGPSSNGQCQLPSPDCLQGENPEAQQHREEHHGTEQVELDRASEVAMQYRVERSRQAASQAAMAGNGMEDASGHREIGRGDQEDDQEAQKQASRYGSPDDSALIRKTGCPEQTHGSPHSTGGTTED